MALAGAVDLKVANSPLRIDGCESEVGIKSVRSARSSVEIVTGQFTYGKFPVTRSQRKCPKRSRNWRTADNEEGHNRPTFDEASVSELRVDDFPALGFPTRPISGSLGILKRSFYEGTGLAKELKIFGKFGGAGIECCTCLQIEGPKIRRQALTDRDYLQ